MSDSGGEEEQQNQKKFFIDRAKTGRSACKKCKQKIDACTLRIAKAGYNPFGGGMMKMWHHVNCMFEVFTRQRATTAKIETPDDVAGWSDLDEDDQQEILKFLPKCKDWKPSPKDTSKQDQSKDKDKIKDKGKTKDEKVTQKDKNEETTVKTKQKEAHKDDSFREFRRLCASISDVDSYNAKTAVVKNFFTKGTDGSSFKGDLHLWCRLLLPQAVKRVYNLQSKALVKLFSKIFNTDEDDMLEDLEKGDIAETISSFFEKSTQVQPTKKSALYLQDVDKFLEELSGLTKENDQSHHFKQFAKQCTSNDLKMVIRLVKHDLRVNAGPKHILEAVHPDAYQAFQTSRDLDAVLSKAVDQSGGGSSQKKSLKITVSLTTPVLPMLPNDKEDDRRNEDTNAEKQEHTDRKRTESKHSDKKHYSSEDKSVKPSQPNDKDDRRDKDISAKNQKHSDKKKESKHSDETHSSSEDNSVRSVNKSINIDKSSDNSCQSNDKDADRNDVVTSALNQDYTNFNIRELIDSGINPFSLEPLSNYSDGKSVNIDNISSKPPIKSNISEDSNNGNSDQTSRKSNSSEDKNDIENDDTLLCININEDDMTIDDNDDEPIAKSKTSEMAENKCTRTNTPDINNEEDDHDKSHKKIDISEGPSNSAHQILKTSDIPEVRVDNDRNQPHKKGGSTAVATSNDKSTSEESKDPVDKSKTSETDLDKSDNENHSDDDAAQEYESAEEENDISVNVNNSVEDTDQPPHENHSPVNGSVGDNPTPEDNDSDGKKSDNEICTLEADNVDINGDKSVNKTHTTKDDNKDVSDDNKSESAAEGDGDKSVRTHTAKVDEKSVNNSEDDDNDDINDDKTVNTTKVDGGGDDDDSYDEIFNKTQTVKDDGDSVSGGDKSVKTHKAKNDDDSDDDDSSSLSDSSEDNIGNDKTSHERNTSTCKDSTDYTSLIKKCSVVLSNVNVKVNTLKSSTMMLHDKGELPSEDSNASHGVSDASLSSKRGRPRQTHKGTSECQNNDKNIGPPLKKRRIVSATHKSIDDQSLNSATVSVDVDNNQSRKKIHARSVDNSDDEQPLNKKRHTKSRVLNSGIDQSEMDCVLNDDDDESDKNSNSKLVANVDDDDESQKNDLTTPVINDSDDENPVRQAIKNSNNKASLKKSHSKSLVKDSDDDFVEKRKSHLSEVTDDNSLKKSRPRRAVTKQDKNQSDNETHSKSLVNEGGKSGIKANHSDSDDQIAKKRRPTRQVKSKVRGKSLKKIASDMSDNDSDDETSKESHIRPTLKKSRFKSLVKDSSDDDFVEKDNSHLSESTDDHSLKKSHPRQSVTNQNRNRGKTPDDEDDAPVEKSHNIANHSDSDDQIVKTQPTRRVRNKVKGPLKRLGSKMPENDSDDDQTPKKSRTKSLLDSDDEQTVNKGSGRSVKNRYKNQRGKKSQSTADLNKKSVNSNQTSRTVRNRSAQSRKKLNSRTSAVSSEDDQSVRKSLDKSDLDSGNEQPIKNRAQSVRNRDKNESQKKSNTKSSSSIDKTLRESGRDRVSTGGISDNDQNRNTNSVEITRTANRSHFSRVKNSVIQIRHDYGVDHDDNHLSSSSCEKKTELPVRGLSFKDDIFVVDCEEDEYVTFGNFVAQEIRSLQSVDNRRELKRIIQKAILDMAEKDDQNECVNDG